jgi:hypothetical protein
MSKSFLLSNKFKKIGWYILVPSFLIGMFLTISGYEPEWLTGNVLSVFPSLSNDKYFTVINVNFVNTIVGILFIVGGLLVGFSKEKNEDEFISKIRLSSLLWAVLVNYILLVVAFVFVYDSAFFSVMIYNMFTVLIIFIVRFNYILFKNSKVLANAE